jgi:P27 family predicted phage terminase small subunit
MRGRRPKNPKLKILTGSRRQAPEPPRPVDAVATPPEWLSPEARKEWDRIAPQLAARGLLTVLDEHSVAVYCECVSTYLEAKRIVEKEGPTYKANGLTKRHPAVAMAAQAARDCGMWARELGLVPSARQRLNVDEPDTEDDEFQAFIDGTATSN